MNESYEIVVGEAPFVVRRTVRWSDCDPAQIVFTGRFTEYLLGAVSHFMRHIAQGPMAAFSEALGVDTPCKAMSLAFHIALRPDDVVDIEMKVGRIGAHSFDLLAVARLPDGRTAFEGTFSPICIQREPRRKAPIPALLRERLQSHVAEAT